MPTTNFTKAGNVYLIHAINTNLYKIGVTRRTVRERLKELNSGQSPHFLEEEHSVFVDDMFGVEYELHQKYQLKQYRNEWFRFHKTDLNSVKNSMTQFVNTKPTTFYDIKSNILAILVLTISVVIFGFFFRKSVLDKSDLKICQDNNGGVACQKLLK